MAKEKTKAAPAKAAGTGTKKAVRTNEQLLAMGNKGKVFAIARAAYGVVGAATGGKFGGVPKLAVKYPNGAWYAKTKAKGAYWGLDENGDEFKKILAAAKAAKSDIAQKKNSGAVHALLTAIMSVTMPGGGPRNRNTEWVDKVTF